MNRTFHHNVSLQGIATIVLLAVVALWCFLVRSGITPALGFVCLLLGAAGVDRLVNTTYTFTADGDLVIIRGRLGKSITIAVNEIIVARAVPHRDRIRLRKDNVCATAADKRIHRRDTAQTETI